MLSHKIPAPSPNSFHQVQSSNFFLSWGILYIPLTSSIVTLFICVTVPYIYYWQLVCSRIVRPLLCGLVPTSICDGSQRMSWHLHWRMWPRPLYSVNFYTHAHRIAVISIWRSDHGQTKRRDPSFGNHDLSDTNPLNEIERQ